MKFWVIDTNVVVSGLMSPGGMPARVLDAMVDGRVKLVFDSRILAEYRDVLRRPRLRLDPVRVDAFLRALTGQHLVAPVAVQAAGPDPDDLIFIAAALAVPHKAIVTGNVAHYPLDVLQGVRVLTPAQAVAELDSPRC